MKQLIVQYRLALVVSRERCLVEHTLISRAFRHKDKLEGMKTFGLWMLGKRRRRSFLYLQLIDFLQMTRCTASARSSTGSEQALESQDKGERPSLDSSDGDFAKTATEISAPTAAFLR